ncbi:hypothetical protein ACFY0G_23860 [Streptomyces sp. NPDC001552]|uniref:hypothetical protein n=1 Tax=Streptomyces sp. NPDC001552 TaxID=3364587 RepID=UPI00368C2470
MPLADIDTFAGNEPFAAQILAYCTEPGLDPERMNPHGGSIALGEPYGAAGARLTTTDHHRTDHSAPRRPHHRPDQRRRRRRPRHGRAPGTRLVARIGRCAAEWPARPRTGRVAPGSRRGVSDGVLLPAVGRPPRPGLGRAGKRPQPWRPGVVVQCAARDSTLPDR